MRGAAKKAARAGEADPQKSAVYAFETDWEAWNNSDLSLQECRDAIRWACDRYGVRAPRVRQHREDTYSWCDVAIGVISMQATSRRNGRGGKNAATALHEAAHWIVFDLFGDRPQDHGPTFVRVFLGLLAGYGVAPRTALVASAREHGLRW